MFWRCLLERQTAWAAEPKTVALAAEPVGRAAVKARGAGGARARGGEGEAAGACTCRRDELCILVRWAGRGERRTLHVCGSELSGGVRVDISCESRCWARHK